MNRLAMRNKECIFYELSKIKFSTISRSFYNINIINWAFNNKINLKIRFHRVYIDISDDFDDEPDKPIIKYKRKLLAMRVMR